MPKIERYSKAELVEYGKSIGLNVKGKSKNELILEVQKYDSNEIRKAIEIGTDHEFLYAKIEKLAEEYSTNLNVKIASRIEEMKSDDNSHYLIYKVLGINEREGMQIDEYQNKGRFL